MVIAYWVVAIVLALFYLYGGGLKIVRSQEQLRPMMKWAGTLVPMPVVRAIGAVEVLGAIGLVLPPLTGVAVALALWAAVGLAVLQALAGVVHVRSDGFRDALMNIVLLVMAGAAAWLTTAL
ncbi:DoxX family protein [Aeromicrobium endophyticum]|uniref:DoxX family protein n=1 Tax=Aeromicrobium endophyticum TaxID=2292704 RepID=A0A371NYW8_9ACTN|nr:DoxX family protein [Aeromicrobium endophyticum]REK68892.1 DoxX family protein [Aeromicrobium endophyticum]